MNSISPHEFLAIAEVKDDSGTAAATGYTTLLNFVRASVSANHAKELSAALDDPAAARNLRELIRRYAAEALSGQSYDLSEVTEKIYQDMAGLGILTQYLRSPNVEEININSYDAVEIIYHDRTEYLLGADAFPSPQAAIDVIRRMIRMGGKLIDAQSPLVDSFIGSGTRINAAIPPVVPAERGVSASIRKQSRSCITREELIKAGTATGDMLDFLTICLSNGVSVGLCGGTGSGKTTLQSFILNEYIHHCDNPNTRIFTAEDSQELTLLKYDAVNDRPARVVSMLTQEAPTRITISDLLKAALRHHPSLIVPAEVRGPEVMQAIAAGQSGHTILTSFHADGAKDGYRRLVSLCRMGETTLTDEMLLSECVGAWPGMAFAKQLKDGTRRIVEIFEATGQKNGRVTGNMLYSLKITETKRDERGLVKEVAAHHERVGNISPRLYGRLRDNGVSEDELHRLFPDAKGADSL